VGSASRSRRLDRCIEASRLTTPSWAASSVPSRRSTARRSYRTRPGAAGRTRRPIVCPSTASCLDEPGLAYDHVKELVWLNLKRDVVSPSDMVACDGMMLRVPKHGHHVKSRKVLVVTSSTRVSTGCRTQVYLGTTTNLYSWSAATSTPPRSGSRSPRSRLLRGSLKERRAASSGECRAKATVRPRRGAALATRSGRTLHL